VYLAYYSLYKLDSVGLDLHCLCTYLTSSIASLHSFIKLGIDLVYMIAVGIVSLIAFWITVVMSLVTWSKSSLDIMCWLLGSRLWSAYINTLMSTFLYFLCTTLVGLLSNILELLQLGSDLKHSLAPY
jgi:ABC-type Fe3+ transport system permease subunit